MKEKQFRYILGQRVDFTSYHDAKKIILNLSKINKASFICASNVHMVMESYDDYNFQNIVNTSNLVTPDGMPLVWALKLLGIKNAVRVYGPKLMMDLLSLYSKENLPIGLYGGTEKTKNMLLKILPQKYKGLKINYSYSPPFRKILDEEKKEINQKIIESKCKILFVALGCPKQEKWMFENYKELSIPLIGVGAAFDFIANPKNQAPVLMQKIGLEWFYRLTTEPKRLWYRYLYHNPRFIALFSKQLLCDRLFRKV